jgi:methionine biosynthesis protein MetW
MSDVKSYYETYWSEEGFFPHGRMWPGLVRLYERHIAPGTDVLDLGCGDGMTSGVWIKERQARYVGVDISANGVKEAERLGLRTIQIGDAATLPFGDAAFDVVVCIEVLEHLFSPQAALAEIQRVLRPGGTAIITVPNVAAWRWRLDFFLFGRWNPIGDELSAAQPWRDPHIRFFTIAAMRRLLEAQGFAIKSLGGHGGGVLQYVPGLRRFARHQASSMYRWMERIIPSLLAHRIEAVVTKHMDSAAVRS